MIWLVDHDRPIVAFIDVETCGKTCWPVMCGYETSIDLMNNSSTMPDYLHDGMCDLIERVLESPAMAALDSRLVGMRVAEEANLRGINVVCSRSDLRDFKWTGPRFSVTAHHS